MIGSRERVPFAAAELGVPDARGAGCGRAEYTGVSAFHERTAVTRSPAEARRAITSLTSRAAALVAFFAIFAAALLAAVCLAASASASTNPSTAEIGAKLQDAAAARGIPPEILYAIAFQESAWRQFDANGDPLIGFDGLGIGIMQVTSYVAYDLDVERLKADIDYNIASGADILLEKRTWTPVIGDGDTRCYETWFYAAWAYNGWTADNPYPYQVWRHVADGPEGWWTGVPVTAVPKASLVNGLGVTTPTPQPAHYWSPTPLPKPTLSAPRAPARVKAGVRFTVSGTLAPRHAVGARSVEVRCYRTGGGGWILKKTVLSTNSDAGELTTWTTQLGLAQTGRWKLVAHALADADHAAASSGPAYVTVR